jgi:hypothetical protein
MVNVKAAVPRKTAISGRRNRVPQRDVDGVAGDLIFFGTPQHIHRVGILLGSTKIIHAPDANQTVRIADYRNFPDYVGASRPTTH